MKELSKVPQNIPVTEFIGKIKIGGVDVPCAVLYPDSENPVRVFWQREIVYLLTGNKKGGLDRYLKPKNLQPFVPEKFKDKPLADSTILFKTPSGGVAQGFLGSDLIDICKMYMSAKLLPNQEHLRVKSQIIVFSFAKTGVDAIIDEATGYEKVRKDFSLMRNLEKYLSKEIQQFKDQLDIDFYKGIYRLNNWAYDDESIKKRSPIIGKWTNEIIYARFPVGVLGKIQERNPVVKKEGNKRGYRKHKNYNLLTEHIGLPALQQYISNAMFLMNVAPNWRKFKGMLAKALGKPYQGDMFDDSLQ